ncbi:flagellar hook-basal body complex protein FliE [Borreliella burgdorferi]|uniref:flagellar hook-basal body complex protein FliE n=1 Tax=Borreliella burgdorferi TaxID=139 RepID=UPI00016C4624|nr:flagellar hook-basal body complex protein FliE [Borreliella burgdorferi]AXK70287.1 Flagellar hook-basal body complex protein FliE [Borreliella burgdorferi]EEG99825.1 flagellar hook-basal body complex protein [Borreliella burgdorferi 94a]MCD2321506.1 flagellar hook-basal body complex protein FliE [Borreliella burgdorferi]MCD2330711.1 flagellar hook-basal body complex protein FliE [Borreliella burgdorferi]MCD2408023.1 flagellar hook-basal body complex protein FliE [Borreliella burgdorferi]
MVRIDAFFTENNINLVKKNPLHFDVNIFSSKSNAKDNDIKTFKDVLINSITDVNKSQLNVSKVTEQAILKPSSIDVHDVVIAMSKANMNLSILKAVVERGVKAYQDIINIR